MNMQWLGKALVGLVCGAALAVSAGAFAEAPPVHVEKAWIRWLPANLPAAAYAEIVNDSDATVRLVGASSPDYGMVMLHRSRLAHGDSTMEHVEGADIPAHGRLTLSPGGYHLMLSHPTRTLKPGDTVTMTLEFAGGGNVKTTFPVQPANASGPP